jgi:hypothetical protein
MLWPHQGRCKLLSRLFKTTRPQQLAGKDKMSTIDRTIDLEMLHFLDAAKIILTGFITFTGARALIWRQYVGVQRTTIFAMSPVYVRSLVFRLV